MRPADHCQREGIDMNHAGQRNRRRVSARAALAALGLATASAVVTSPEAHAAIDPYYALAGNFAGDFREEVFVYRPGGAQDFLLRFGDNGQGLITAFTTFNVNGSYDPVVGDFDADPYDEILWYAPGAAADVMWSFTSFTTVTGRALTVSGFYDPVAGDFNGDGYDDVFWYGPGTAPDRIWFYSAFGPVSRTAVVNGVYRPVVGSFGKDATDDIYWYAPGAAPDSLWDFTRGSGVPTSKALAAGGNYRPFSVDFFNEGWRGEDIFFYDPAAADKLWDFYLGGLYSGNLPQQVTEAFVPASGDYLVDGFEDVLWLRANGTWMFWDSNGCNATHCFWQVHQSAGPAAAGAAQTAAAVGSVSMETDA
jgi:hypothetical protein